jgi:hypothetical protein
MRYFASIAACSLFFLACKSRLSNPGNTPASPDQTTTAATVNLPAGFMEFYTKFHEDSLYQIAHINWPLQGETSVQTDSTHYAKKNIAWELKNWRMHRPVDFSTGDFKRDFQVLADIMVIEKIRYKAANYGLERRFSQDEKKEWNLIYYSDIQEIKQ